MELNLTFRLDGVPHDRESLMMHCRLALAQNEVPDWKKELCVFLLEWSDPSRTAFDQMTSGTTGQPKLYRLQRSAMIKSALNTIEAFGLCSGDRILLCLPVQYIAGKMMAVRAMVGGMDLVTIAPSGRPVPQLEGRVVFAAMVPMQVHESLEHGDDLSAVDTLLIGGGEIHPALRERLSRLEHPMVYESFAMTETITHFALRRINGEDAEEVFKPMGGVEVSRDDRGCLIVSVEEITDGPVYTNDLVEFGPDGKGFIWLGRADHMINSGGIKIIPEVLEQKITGILGKTCLVLPEPDPVLGEKLLLLVESDEPEPPLELWRSRLREALQRYEVPKRIAVALNIPRNASLKPDRKAALQLLRNL